MMPSARASHERKHNSRVDHSNLNTRQITGLLVRCVGHDSDELTVARHFARMGDVEEPGGATHRCELYSVFWEPTVARVANGVGRDFSLGRNEPSTWREHAMDFVKAKVEIFPVVHRSYRPYDVRLSIG